MTKSVELEKRFRKWIDQGAVENNPTAKNTAVRIKRAISWLQRAEEEEKDDDAKVIFLWIAFNALYGRDMYKKDELKQHEFLKNICSLDICGKIHLSIKNKCGKECVKLIRNRFVDREYWNDVRKYLRNNGEEPEIQWKDKENPDADKAEKRFFNSNYEIQSLSGDLENIFQRLYVLRNQIVHGSATWNKDVNRDQVKDGANILATLIPVFIKLMIPNLNSANKSKVEEKNWGDIYYPPYLFWDKKDEYFLGVKNDAQPDLTESPQAIKSFVANDVELAIPQSNAVIIGFDSAWVDKSPGAICAIAFDAQSNLTFHEPCLVSFSEALEFIKDKRQGHDFSLVAIDQPIVVPNETGSRPVDRVAASQISFVGGGVQPANRGKKGMFCDNSPIWSFLSGLNSRQKPMDARTATNGHFLVEVFPALALSALHSDFAKRNAAPKYNPANKRKFRLADWRVVARIVAGTARQLGIVDLASWADGMGSLDKPGKADQDCLDASICALVGLLWRGGSASHSAMLGDVDTGYMITPVSDETKGRLESAAHERDVPFRMPQSKK